MLFLWSAAGVSFALPDGLLPVLTRHREFYGDSAVLEHLDSLQFQGVVLERGREYPFTLSKASGGRFRVEVHVSAELVCVQLLNKDGGFEWWRRDSLPERGSFARLEGARLEWLEREAQLLSPLLTLDNFDGQIRFDRAVSAGGGQQFLDRVELVSGNGVRQTLFLDLFQSRLLRSELELRDAGVVIETRYADYRTFRRLRIPTRLTNRVNGEILNEVRVTSMVVNPPFIGLLFRVPMGFVSELSGG